MTSPRILQFLSKESRRVKYLLWLSGLKSWLVSMRMQVWSLTLLSGLRIRCCCELQGRLWTRLGSGIAVTVVYARSCSSDLIPSLGTSICCECGPKKEKKKKISSMKYNSKAQYLHEITLQVYPSLPREEKYKEKQISPKLIRTITFQAFLSFFFLKGRSCGKWKFPG